MAKYSTFKFGDGTKYGTLTKASAANLLWTFIVAWTDEYTGFNEASRMVDLTVHRGRNYLLSAAGSGFEYIGIGEAVGIFDNSDGRYDPWNTSSPLYPNVRAGKFARIAVLDNETDTNYGIMRGIVDDIQPMRYGDREVVRIVIKDGMQWLQDRLVHIGLKEGQDRDACISDILTAAEWPTAEWPLDLSDSLDDLVWWWAWKEWAIDAIRELTDAEIGIFFHDRDGKAVFRGRDYTHNRTKAVDQAELLVDMVVPQPWEVVRNSIDIYAVPKLLDEDIEIGTGLFRFQDTVAIDIGETVTLDCVFNNIILAPGTGSAPRGTLKAACGRGTVTTFTVDEEADGTGADLTDDCTLTEGEVGNGVQVSITNNSASNGYLIFLRVNGDAVYPTDISTQRANDTISQSKYGIRSLVINSYWQESNDLAKAIAAYLLAELKYPMPNPTIKVENRADIQFYLDLYDRIELTIAKKGIDSNFRVGSIEHRWLTENGQSIETTFQLEPYFTVFS